VRAGQLAALTRQVQALRDQLETVSFIFLFVFVCFSFPNASIGAHLFKGMTMTKSRQRSSYTAHATERP
jgi:hypothetical protein